MEEDNPLYAIGFFIIFILIVTQWITVQKIWYCTTHSIKWNNVIINKEPSDCNWNYAPIGIKGCSYTKEIFEVKCGISRTGEPLLSYDGGRNWSTCFSCVPSLEVTWKKELDK